MESDPRIVARFVVDDFFSAHPAASVPQHVAELAVRVETALRAAAAGERQACAALCERRAALWSGTEARAETPPSMRGEARERAKEAAYLADAIRSRR